MGGSVRKHRPGHYILLVLFVAAMAAMASWYGVAADRLWAIPACLLAFVLAYVFDVPIPGLGRINADHVIAFPAVLLLGNPVLTGVLAGGGYLISRLFRPSTLRPGLALAFDFFHTGLSTAFGTALVLASGRFSLEGRPTAIALLWLIAGVWVQFASSLVMVAAYRFIEGGARKLSANFWKGAGKTLAWVTLSIPYVALVMFEIQQRNVLTALLSLLPLAAIAWVLEMAGEKEQKNAELIEATRRQEFLLQMLSSESGSLENESFLNMLLSGLNEFVPWDAELLFAAETPFQREPILYSRSSLPQDPYAAKSRLEAMLESGSLKLAKAHGGRECHPLLMPKADHQLLVPLATREVAFGVFVAEREGDRPFTEAEIQFANLAMAQIASYVQDEILKRQILSTNNRLTQQTHYLSEILDVSNLLKIHMDPQTILEKVARGIQQSVGFQSVLISLYRQEEACFERVAQAGVDARWDEIKQVRPPAAQMLDLLKDKYRVGNCYFVRHTEGEAISFGVMPANLRPASEPDDWDPMDLLLVPMFSKDNHLIGIISVDEPSDGKVPSMEAFNALEIIANQAVQALESSQAHASVRHQAAVDGLTNLYNHRYFHEALTAVAREHEAARRPYSVIMMDLDNFKEINDRWGHLSGDAVLRGIGEIIQSVTRREDVAARYGGEEFALVLPGLDAKMASGVGDRVRKLVEEGRFEVEDIPRPLKVTLSAGVASYPKDGEDRRKVLEQADAALYQAKKAGKNRVCEVA
jgi:diguanylate cyclase (GGDEF)-like protein